ncbi:MAG: hypothetical protein K9H26_10240 [Prolixibacteraceae bacterium]|nr:hypothetical protein [Prolixibacteraceae bacterium]
MIRKENLKLLAMTPCCVDFYPQLVKSFLGGNSLNVASMWKKLEPKANVSVITGLGNDENGKHIVRFLKQKNIDTSRIYISEGTTACNQLRVDDQAERYGIEGTWNGGVYESFRLSDDDWKHVNQQDIVAIPANNPNFQSMLERKNPKQFLSVDYLDIENNIPLADTVSFTDIAFITARRELLPQYCELATAKKKLIVVTLGAHGSYAFFNGQSYHQPALPVPKKVDSTGCGDAYQAAFALCFLKSKNIQRSMEEGAKAASVVLQAWGGVGEI